MTVFGMVMAVLAVLGFGGALIFVGLQYPAMEGDRLAKAGILIVGVGIVAGLLLAAGLLPG